MFVKKTAKRIIDVCESSLTEANSLNGSSWIYDLHDLWLGGGGGCCCLGVFSCLVCFSVDFNESLIICCG